MSLSRPTRSVIALLTAILLLLCQTAFAAQACAQALASGGSAAVATPCHHTADSDGVPAAPAKVAGCDAAKAVGDSAKVHVIALADLPAVLVAYDAAVSRRDASDVRHAVQPVCHSPPLPILHCRLLN